MLTSVKSMLLVVKRAQLMLLEFMLPGEMENIHTDVLTFRVTEYRNCQQFLKQVFSHICTINFSETCFLWRTMYSVFFFLWKETREHVACGSSSCLQLLHVGARASMAAFRDLYWSAKQPGIVDWQVPIKKGTTPSPFQITREVEPATHRLPLANYAWHESALKTWLCLLV